MIQYWSWMLNLADGNYMSAIKESLAVVRAIQVLDPYIKET